MAPHGNIAAPRDREEIVVTAERYGEAKVAAETEFDEAEIAGQGADSIQDLLTRLSPFIDPGGEQPVILINGKAAGFDQSILSYPAEALQRLAVLEPGAAAAYGEPADKRVVNLVLKKKFSMLSTDAGADFATAGGQYGGTLSATRTAISGDTRWNVQVRIGADSAFRKAARDIPPRDGVFDAVGFVSALDGGDIDPALTLTAGEAVGVAAIPPGAVAGVPGLDDFAATANVRHSVDPNRFETLQSSRRTASLNLGITRPVGEFTASLNLNASRSISEGERGLPMASVVLPATSRWSPFAGDVLLTRPLAGTRALRIGNGATNLGASLTINGNLGSWQTNMGVSYSRGWTNNLFENSIDTDRVQQRIDAGEAEFNPFGPWKSDLLLARRGRTRTENLAARLNLRKTIIDLPAGPLVWNFTGNASRNRSHNRQQESTVLDPIVNDAVRRQMNGQMTLSLPISQQGKAGPRWLGDLSANLSARAQTMTDSPAQKGFGGSLNWSPLPTIQLSGSIDYAEAAPTFDQLDAPLVTTVRRVFDYARQEAAEPLWITGGNPELRRGSRQTLSLAATVRPLHDQRLTLNIAYRATAAKGGAAAFPELTPAIEAAFPERVTRDSDGRLVTVDARAINIERNSDAEFSWGIALRLGKSAIAAEGAPPADPLQFSLSINHRWRLKSELVTRSGLPAIDQLRAGGQPRHNLSLQASVGRRGMGASVNGNWSSGSRISGTDQTFLAKSPILLNLSLFVEPAHWSGDADGAGILDDLKLSIDVRNLLNGYRHVLFSDGTAVPGYSRYQVDPLGRTVQLSIRKRF